MLRRFYTDAENNRFLLYCIVVYYIACGEFTFNNTTLFKYLGTLPSGNKDSRMGLSNGFRVGIRFCLSC